MTRRTFPALAVVLVALTGRAAAAEPMLTVKVADAPPPKELSASVRALLDTKAISVSDGGKLLCTIWPCKALKLKAPADPAQYSNLEETTVVGAVRFPAVWTDYRKQKIKPGVYTLRLGIQPMDGDHMGTAPYNEFLLLSPAGKDQKPDLMDAKDLQEMSTASTTRKHPGVVLLFPNPKPAAAPAIEAKPNEHWVLNFQVPVAGGKSALGFGLVVVGHSMSE